MLSNRRSVVLACALGLALGLVSSSAGVAQGPGGGDAGSWTVRGFGAWVEPTDDSFAFGRPIEPPLPDEPSSAAFTLDDGSGWGLGLEYRLTRRLGVEAQAIVADLDSELELRFGVPVNLIGVDRREVGIDLYSLGLNVHLTPERRLDVYAGLLGALVSYDDFRGQVGGITFRREGIDDTAVGLALGADLFLDRSRRWAATAAVRQLWSTGDAGDDLGIDVDPRIVTAGVAVRWGG
jgi:hypothetical protein